MDPAAHFGAPIDTFSKTFSSDQYAALFAANPQVLASPELATQGFPFDPLGTTADPFGTSKSPISPSNNPPHAPNINPRSCTTCRKRKVRCDKKHPCSNCHKAGIECIFPRPGRAPRRSKKPPDSELLARLRRLEGVVQSLGKGVDGEDLSPDHAEGGEGRNAGEGDATNPQGNSGRPQGATLRCTSGRKALTDTTGLEKEMGRLVVGDGRSRYMSNNFWASLTSEVGVSASCVPFDRCYIYILFVDPWADHLFLTAKCGALVLTDILSSRWLKCTTYLMILPTRTKTIPRQSPTRAPRFLGRTIKDSCSGTAPQC